MEQIKEMVNMVIKMMMTYTIKDIQTLYKQSKVKPMFNITYKIYITGLQNKLIELWELLTYLMIGHYSYTTHVDGVNNC